MSLLSIDGVAGREDPRINGFNLPCQSEAAQAIVEELIFKQFLVPPGSGSVSCLNKTTSCTEDFSQRQR